MNSLLKKYPNKLIITQGKNGVKYFNRKEYIVVPCIKVNVVDTTGAGDTFNGAFGVSISEGSSIYESIKFANTAAGISVTKMGAQPGMPCRAEVLRYINVLEE
jgi:ribokinase